MRLRRIVLLGAVVMLFAGLAEANTIPPDPGIKVVGENTKVAYQPIFTTTFDVLPFFQSCAGTGFSGDLCAFLENDTNTVINSMGFAATYVNTPTTLTGGPLICNSGTGMDSFPLNNCPEEVPASPFSIVLFGGPGIGFATLDPPGQLPPQFAVIVDGWGTNSSQLTGLDATLNAPIPEPGTMALLLTGVSVLAARRKLRKARDSRR